MTPTERKGMWFGLLGVTMFAVTLPVTRLAVGTPEDPHLSGVFLAMGRAVVAACLSVIYLWISKAAFPSKNQWKGLGLVALFMVLRYGLFGIFANVALALNLILLLAALTPLATLTLPGIAGIVLTLGMAVDANVLIFERIREEQRNGRGMLASIDQGFRRARDTIIDANMTHLIAALILFELGSGPVRGFAVALGFGIATSFFTSVSVISYHDTVCGIVEIMSYTLGYFHIFV